MKKTIYFVRHGETDLNRSGIHQSTSAELSAQGRRQARQLASRLRGLEIEAILASSAVRTLQTAEALAGDLGVDIVATPHLLEVRRPSLLLGRHEGEDEVREVKAQIWEHIEDPQWHHSDDENFADFAGRARLALAEVAARPEGKILAVTHRHFMHVIFGTMLFGDDLAPATYRRLYGFLELNNTGVAICTLSPGGEWKLVRWNDTAHLEELSDLG